MPDDVFGIVTPSTMGLDAWRIYMTGYRARVEGKTSVVRVLDAAEVRAAQDDERIKQILQREAA